MSAPGSSRPERLPGHGCTIPVPPITPGGLDDQGKPRVLISGGGIGGLTLAILLHKASIPFLVLEKAKEIKPLGAAMGMGATVIPLFTQLGIRDDFLSRAKHYTSLNMLKEDLTLTHTLESGWLTEAVGFGEYVIARPELYDLLWRQIPRERILLGKKILSFTQNSEIVLVRCSDGSAYYGNILVGADGAYSAVRQHLYKDLKIDKSPISGQVALPFSCVCLVGQTQVLDPDEFPLLKEELSQCDAILGVSTMCTWATTTTKQNTVCWMVIHFLDKHSLKRNDSFRNSEWGPEEAEALAREVRPFKVPGGKDGRQLTLGEYIDQTPRQQMSKVMLEEIVFDTWYGGRTVLLGDACHKMSPAGGAGAVTAIHDAVTLANWISTLRYATEKDVEKVFKEYRAERYPVAMQAFESSQMFIQNLGKNMRASLVRGMIKRLPHWLWRRIILKKVAPRNQASFLPLAEDNAKAKPLYQRSLHKTLAIHRELARNLEATLSNNPVAV